MMNESEYFVYIQILKTEINIFYTIEFYIYYYIFNIILYFYTFRDNILK